MSAATTTTNTPASTSPSSPSTPTSPSSPSPSLMRCIIYLEPSSDSQFYQSIESYFAQTFKLFGANEAHQYQPHVSLTGFFSLHDTPNSTALEKLNVVSDAIDEYIAEHSGEFAPPHVEGILLVPPELPAGSPKRPSSPISRPTTPTSPNYHHHHRKLSTCSSHDSLVPPTQSLLIPLSTCPTLHALAKQISELSNQDSRLENINIRRKSINHLSLAYCGDRYLGLDGVQERLSGEVIQKMLKIAKDMIVFDEVKEGKAKWDVVIYENLKSCSRLEDRHLWREVKRWNIVSGA